MALLSTSCSVGSEGVSYRVFEGRYRDYYNIVGIHSRIVLLSSSSSFDQDLDVAGVSRFLQWV